MNLFGKAQNNPTPTDITSRQGSAAEQDTLGSHFGASTEAIQGAIQTGVDKATDFAVNTKGAGAEQETYNQHLSPTAHGGVRAERDQVTAYARRMISRGEKAVGFGSGLGYDGQQMALKMVNFQGVGSEQDRFGAHFGGPEKDQLKRAGRELKDGVMGAYGELRK